MAIITISRQIGSAGDYIGELAASMLSYKLENRKSIIMEAQRRGMIEGKSIDFEDEGKPPVLERFIKNKSEAVYAIRSIIREKALKDKVLIIGCGANMELRDKTGVINIRIIADYETRINRVMQEYGLERVQAVKMIKQSDKERSEYVKHFFLVKVSDPHLYDLVINTSGILPDVAARLIAQMVRSMEIL